MNAQCKIHGGLFRFLDMRLFTTTLLTITLAALGACNQPKTVADNAAEKLTVHEVLSSEDTTQQVTLSPHFSRDSIVMRLREKSANKDLKIIHVLVPLCDNQHQGIVPVNASLGNGQNLRTNLYWGAGYGIRTHFSRSATWKLQQSVMNPSSDILERVIFKHATKNVVLVADAYRGDRMKTCLQDYFQILAGLKTDTISLADSSLVIGNTTDLVAFNGHNGLMDVMIDTIKNVDGKVKDAIAIACASHGYFVDYLNAAGGYPLVMTAHLLAPEAYVLHNVLDAWIEEKTDEETRFAAAQGYHNIQKCGIRGASNLFVTGWKP